MKKQKNFIKSSKFKSIIILFCLLGLYTFICAVSYVQAVSENLSNNIFRLHVVANSDSEEDQNLKYKVRDNLLKYMNSICKDCSSKEEAIRIVYEHKDDFQKIATDTINKEGFNYNVNINIGNFKFPTKYYGDISLPAGLYDALRVEIGSAKGKNWWCVMFPPLCFVDVSSGIVPDDSKEYLESNLSDEEYTLISDNSSEVKIKFKLIELFANNGLLTAKK